MSIEHLTSSNVHQYVDQLVAIDKHWQEELGIIYGSDPWNERHFLADFPEKWALSLVASKGGLQVGGFLIASQPVAYEIHIHRLAIKPDMLKEGIGGQLLKQEQVLMNVNGYRRITIEVNVFNQRALEFYIKNHFIVLKGQALKDFVFQPIVHMLRGYLQ